MQTVNTIRMYAHFSEYSYRSTAVSQLNSIEKFRDKSVENQQKSEIQLLAEKSAHSQHVAQLQGMANNYSSPTPSGTMNRTGLPDTLKTGVEQLSGHSMDDVKVYYNSSKPAQLQAHAYAQGSEIHLAPGQEKHLPHETWHVVQQKQGRVKPTLQLKGNVTVNDDAGLEREADVMGNKALQSRHNEQSEGTLMQQSSVESSTVQRVIHANPHVQMFGKLTLSQEAQDRLDDVAAILDNMLHNDGTIDIDQLVLSVEREGGIDYTGVHSTIQGDNPAETSVIPAVGVGHPGIRVTIQRPFAEKATVGEMLGLLAHEIGVHTIPSSFRGINDFNVNNWNPVITDRKRDKDNTPSGGYEFDNWTPPVLGVTPQRDGNRQHDHLQVIDVLQNPPLNGFAPATRAEIYLDTVLKIGDEIWADNTKSQKERETRVEELIHLYLVDIGRIVASDDGRLQAREHFIALSDVYGETFTNVVLPQRTNHPWIPTSRPKENWLTLSISLAWFIKKVQKEKEKNG